MDPRFSKLLPLHSIQGEYYIDRTTGILYLWPPSRDGNVNSNDDIQASMVDDCFT